MSVVAANTSVLTGESETFTGGLVQYLRSSALTNPLYYGLFLAIWAIWTFNHRRSFYKSLVSQRSTQKKPYSPRCSHGLTVSL
jgi:hypothetical protein